MNWLKKLFGCKEDELNIQIDILKKQLESMQPNPLENVLNSKYPQSNISYERTETDRVYRVDLRDFIQKQDSILPIIDGDTDDKKAINALAWIIENIKYVPDQKEYRKAEYWAYAYQTLNHKQGDCEDGAILLHNILLRNGVPYWKLRLSAGFVKDGNNKIGHAYLNYYSEDTSKWVVLDWCYFPNLLPINQRKDYKDEGNYLDVWFSWNEKYCFTKGLNTDAKKLISTKKSKGGKNANI